MASSESGFAVWRRGGNEHDTVAGLEPAIAMDHQHSIERPAVVRLGCDLGELFFCHPGIMLERQGRNPVYSAHVAHQSNKARDAADPVVAGGQEIEFGADIEILALDADHSLSLR